MNRKVRLAIQIVLTVGLIAFILKQISFTDIVDVMRRLPVEIFILCFLLYLPIYLFRAIRFKLLIQNEVNLKRLFDIACVHGALNHFLPARTGEFSYIFLLRKKENISVYKGAATLIVARMFDFLGFLLFLITALIISRNTLPLSPGYWSIIIGILIFVSFIIVFLAHSRGKVTKFFYNFSQRSYKFRLIQKVCNIGKEISEGVASISSYKVLWSVFFYSISMVFLLSLCNYLIMRELGVDLTFWQMILAFTFTVVTLITPFQGIANLGTFESTCVLGLIAMKVPKTLAIASALGIHLIGYLYVAIIGLYGILSLQIKTEVKKEQYEKTNKS